MVSPREGSISNIRTFLKANIDTQNDAMFEAGDTFSKPSFFGIYVRFRRSAVYIYIFIHLHTWKPLMTPILVGTYSESGIPLQKDTWLLGIFSKINICTEIFVL